MVRIISGDWGGRGLPKVSSQIRPTPDRAREALFSILYSRGIVFSDLHALDLFCGSGSVGLELLSRGAERVIFVDRSRDALSAIDGFLRRAQAADRASTHVWSLPEQARNLSAVCHAGEIDFVFVDAPFSAPLEPAVLLTDPAFCSLLSPNALVVWEQESTQPDYKAVAGWEAVDIRKYGRIRFWLYQRVEPNLR